MTIGTIGQSGAGKVKRKAVAALKKVQRKLEGEGPVERVVPQNTPAPLSWLDVMLATPGISKTVEERIAMTVSCKDADYIPKVKGAGGIKTIKGKKYQVMHNGLLVELGGYFDEWMATIITQLDGHHEPQEEKLFYEVVNRLPKGSSMIELGAYWAYYSLWFNRAVKDAQNYCCEPDPVNLALGKRNAKINELKNMEFIAAAAGKNDGEMISFTPQEGGRPDVTVPIRSIDGIVEEYGIEKLGLAHMDVQGAELSALEGALESIKSGKIRFLFVSTHHYTISGEILMHEKCLELIKNYGGHIVAEHAIHESFSGDGLIVASFSEEDKNWTVPISANRMQDGLFRPYNRDLAALVEAYNEQAKR
jgi:FkbM family methyltransferase